MTALRSKTTHLWKRDGLDWYVEEPRATTALLRVEKFIGPVWDPCCGQGNITKALLAAGYEAFGSDIVRRTSELWFMGERDFLKNAHRCAPNIVMNPPFFRGKGTEEFIRVALNRAQGKVAVFVDVKFLCGAGRANGLYAEHPPSRIWYVTPRVSCPPGEWLAQGNKAGGGTADYCWLVWDLTAPPGGSLPVTGWLREASR